ncbi:MAG: AAA family ATPase [Lachnospiraceae bacterium]|nr:AAA family ATPase [Lachnospiraceae bacterium]
MDKTHFIKEWWESEDIVTLITRPRRFGKTLNMLLVLVLPRKRFLIPWTNWV